MRFVQLELEVSMPLETVRPLINRRCQAGLVHSTVVISQSRSPVKLRYRQLLQGHPIA